MAFSIKNTLPLSVLFFICSFFCRAEATEEDLYSTEYKFWEKEDFIKVKIAFPEGTVAESTLYKINNPDPNGLSIRIKNDQLEDLDTFYQLVDVELHAVPSHEEGGVTFEIIEKLERIKLVVSDELTVADMIINTTKYFFKTDKQVNFRNDVLPYLTFSGESPNIKYVKFFTKP